MIADRDRFWTLAESEHLKARSFCRKLTGSREDGEDLLQDSLVKAMTRFNELRDPNAFRPWLYRIVINTFRSRVRRRWWGRVVPLTRQIRETVAGDNPSDRNRAKRILEEAFKAVSPEERAMVTLFEMEGWSLKELAALYGKSTGSLKVRLSRIRAKMRKALASNRPDAAKRGVIPELTSEVDICVASKSGTD